MKFFPCLIITTCITLCSNNVFGQCSNCGNSQCSRVFSGCQPVGFDDYTKKNTYTSSQICCSNWSSSDDFTYSCSAANITSGSATGITITNYLTGNTLKFNGGTTSSGGTGGGGTTITGNGVDCTTSNCNQVTLTDANGKLFCWTGQTGPCSGNTSNTVGMESCGLFDSKCYNGKGVTDSGGNTQWGPTACKTGYHKYIFDCYKDCSGGYYSTTNTCERCPEYYIDYVNESDKASGKYDRSSANANSVKECFMQAGSVSKDTFTNDIGTYSISSTCYYQ